MTPTEIRTSLLEAVAHGRVVIVTSTRNGEQLRARGKVVSVTSTHFVLSWRTGESVLPLSAVTNVEETRERE